MFLLQLPEGARQPAANYLVFYLYSPKGVTYPALPMLCRLEITNFPYSCHLAPSLGVTPFKFMEKLY